MHGFMELNWAGGGRLALLAAYSLLLGVIALYGVHRLLLLYLFLRRGPVNHQPVQRFESEPRVTVQLPMYNEGEVAFEVIDAVCRLDWPRDKLHVQVVDDSTDHSLLLVRQRVAHWRAEGIDIELIHREDRQGYKAGALAAATPHAKGEYLAIFDADFRPRPSFLRETIDHFADPAVGMVQARWLHLNRPHSLLTRAQAIFIDGHFVLEHPARCRSGRWMHFNGTAGVWRRTTIDDAGGWSHSTLAEDLDLSVRAQERGWRFLYLENVGSPAELPDTVDAFKNQQHRWNKGTTQAALKHLPRILRSDAPWRIKSELFFQMSNPLASFCITAFALLYLPASYLRVAPWDVGHWGVVAFCWGLVVLGMTSCTIFYAASQRLDGRSFWRTVAFAPVMIVVGVGVSVTNTRGVIEALLGHESGFVRTPKARRGAGRVAAKV